MGPPRSFSSEAILWFWFEAPLSSGPIDFFCHDQALLGSDPPEPPPLCLTPVRHEFLARRVRIIGRFPQATLFPLSFESLSLF